jgi:hypothetical protein
MGWLASINPASANKPPMHKPKYYALLIINILSNKMILHCDIAQMVWGNCIIAVRILIHSAMSLKQKKTTLVRLPD